MARPRERPDEEGFEAFVRSRSTDLLRVAVLLTGDPRQAEDLLQQALLRTARRWPAARQAPVAYMHQVLVNLARDQVRTAARRVTEAPLGEAGDRARVDDQTERFGRRAVVMAALRELPERQREVVVLRFYADLSVAETARAMGASEGTVKSYTARALDRLRAALSEPIQVEGVGDDR